jgi:uncharacterized protein YcfJ
MAKKLKVELDVETSKAKSKVAKDLGGAVDGGGGGGGAASSTSSSAARLEKALSRAAKGAEDFGKESTKTSVNLSNAFKSLAGFGAGMAVNWAANFMPEGKGRNYVERAGSTLQGASMGAAAGEALGDLTIMGVKAKNIAALAGAVAGYAGKTAQQTKAEEEQLKSISDTKSQFEQAKAWRDKMRAMTEMPSHFGAAEDLELLNKQLEAVKAMSANAAKEIENLEKKEAALKAQAEKAANDSRLEESAKKQQEMARVQGQIMQAEAAMHNANRQASSLQNQIDNFKNEVKIQEDRGGISGTDAIARIGGTAGDPVGGGVSPANEEEKSVSKSEPFFFSAKVEELIAKAADKAWSAPKASSGRYFLQDGAKPDTTIDEHILSEEKEMNKTLGDIADTLKNSKGAVW